MLDWIVIAKVRRIRKRSRSRPNELRLSSTTWRRDVEVFGGVLLLSIPKLRFQSSMVHDRCHWSWLVKLLICYPVRHALRVERYTTWNGCTCAWIVRRPSSPCIVVRRGCCCCGCCCCCCNCCCCHVGKAWRRLKTVVSGCCCFRPCVDRWLLLLLLLLCLLSQLLIRS